MFEITLTQFSLLALAAVWLLTGLWLGGRYLAGANRLRGRGQRAALLLYTTIIGFPVLFAIGCAAAVTILWHFLLAVSNRFLNLIRRT